MLLQTCIAPVNIALIKYWGKRDEALILPINDSLSMTLSTDQMCAKTTAAVGSDFKENKMWLNGEEVQFEDNCRTVKCLDEIKRIAQLQGTAKFPLDWKLHICSENNFPTAAGLASSAAGYACLVYTLAKLYGVQNEELSKIARLGSGSACRSIYGGFVQWIKGEDENGNDSIAVQIENEEHWPNMHVLILVVNDNRKKVGSTKGMQRSVLTSDLLKYRADVVVPKRIFEIKNAIKEKNFEKFAEITMKDSNQFHACCLDSYPPCVYMNDVSHAIIDFVHKYNEMVGEVRIAYTFDAGPNACLYLLQENVADVLLAIKKFFPNDNDGSVEYLKGIPIDLKNKKDENIFNCESKPIGRNFFKYIIHTKIGNGPKSLIEEESLLNEVGLPKSFNP
ncbi:diphosphomevalonate decarboxylase [Condylostylus longicornis]|uniref:diphosphomevalonate decarboxylase n=1 Tax=Condylostylus longicornis TaxID=2530218 RepID=UPI00244D99EF|nr:diphosphomevalonate decarboxylase [Condylostylus longicornis]XP_055389944.1 diphosphomevalonate decarboxylase [Condylostylus longicornis]